MRSEKRVDSSSPPFSGLQFALIVPKKTPLANQKTSFPSRPKSARLAPRRTEEAFSSCIQNNPLPCRRRNASVRHRARTRTTPRLAHQATTQSRHDAAPFPVKSMSILARLMANGSSPCRAQWHIRKDHAPLCVMYNGGRARCLAAGPPGSRRTDNTHAYHPFDAPLVRIAHTPPGTR